VAAPKRFLDLTLDDRALRTPEGDMALVDIRRAEFVRDAVVDGRTPGTSETSLPAVGTGAVVGGALLNVPGAIGGALIGSTVDEEVPGRPILRTLSAGLLFESEETEYSRDVTHDQESGAITFARRVDRAARKAQKRAARRSRGWLGGLWGGRDE
jgi:hypothetical protein